MSDQQAETQVTDEVKDDKKETSQEQSTEQSADQPAETELVEAEYQFTDFTDEDIKAVTHSAEYDKNALDDNNVTGVPVSYLIS